MTYLQKHMSLRINAETLAKFRCICRYDGRSANSQLLLYIRRAIRQFEEEHGKISPEECTEN